MVLAGASGYLSVAPTVLKPVDPGAEQRAAELAELSDQASAAGAEDAGALGEAERVTLPDDLGVLGDGEYFNDFSQPLGPEWWAYDSIGHDGWGFRRPSAIELVTDETAAGESVLTITASMGVGDEQGQMVSGGLKLLLPQTYGRYTIRARVEADPSEVTSGVALLWPQSNEWPRDGEIDFMETWANRSSRTPVESNLHWLNPAASEPFNAVDDAKQLGTHPDVDGTLWHIYQLEWREDLVSVSVDGGAPLILSTDPDEIADWPMELAMQLDAFPAPDAPDEQPVLDQPVTMYVDYVLVQP